MSVNIPANYLELSDAIAHRRPFHVNRPFGGTRPRGESVWVLSSVEGLTGPLAYYVTCSASAYRERYLAGMGRNRRPDEVVYYVASGSHVLGYVTAEGRVTVSPGLPPRLHTEVEYGLGRAATLMYEHFRDDAEVYVSAVSA